MKHWTKEVSIHAPIDKIWKLFDGSLEDIRRIMPNIITHEPLTETKDEVGRVYRQVYQEGKRMHEYDVTTMEYANQTDYKKMTTAFLHGKMFRIITSYELIKVAEKETIFRYITANEPLKWYIKPLLIFTGDGVVEKFVEHVKYIAEEEV